MSIGNEEFDGWARSKALDLAYRNFPGVGKYYKCPRTLLALEAWQASRESLVIDLPKKYESDYGAGIYQDDDGDLYLVDDVVKAIEAAGLKVKP